MEKQKNTFTAPEGSQPSQSSMQILNGLQSKHVYAGTVAPVVVQRRRAANKAARKARRANRK